ncbi:sialidase family protein [Crocinitomix catalasitica]|uniref:sialidase family protein n=1 Tax=Crocinitomix catalasitica TaxID=184607 RepID=UPI0004811227|nr:sialidase family protein [Crocinitomix catalasitica]
MMKFFLIVFIGLFSPWVCAQFNNVKIPIPKKATYKFSQVEPSICINPNNTDEIIAGTVFNDYYFSKDGGYTWKSKSLKSKFGVNGDPCVVIDNQGRPYYMHLSNIDGKALVGGIVCQTGRSVKGRFTRVSHTLVDGKFHDKEWAAVNPKNNNVYMTWTAFDAYNSEDPKDESNIVFSKTTDEGKTWSIPKIISTIPGDCADDDKTAEGAVPAVGPEGEIYVAWSRNDSIWFNVSKDEGETWLAKEQFIANQSKGWNLEIIGLFRTNGMPITAADRSGKDHHGDIYVNWADQRNGATDTDIWLKKSSDKGETWSQPIRVNQDTTATHQFFTWMTIDQTTGYLYFVYYSRANFEDFRTDVFMTVSKDGGQTFKEYKINDTPFSPNPKMFFGDYINISAHDGEIRPIWLRLDEGEISLFTTIVNQNQLNTLP